MTQPPSQLSPFNEQEFQRRTGYRSFTEMYFQSYGKLYSCVLRWYKNPTDAEDILQNAFLKMLRYVSTHFETGTDFDAWAYRITINETISHLRKRNKLKKREESLEDNVWIYHFSTNQSMNYLKRKNFLSKREERLLEYFPDCFGEFADKEAPRADQDNLEALWKVTSRGLPSKYKETLELVVLENLEYRNIAERLGIPMGTVMSRLSRARKILEERRKE